MPDDATVNYVLGYDGKTPVIPQTVYAAKSDSITVNGNGNYVLGAGNLMIRGQKFSYASASFSSGQTTFSKVFPDPSGFVQVGDYAYQAEYFSSPTATSATGTASPPANAPTGTAIGAATPVIAPRAAPPKAPAVTGASASLAPPTLAAASA